MAQNYKMALRLLTKTQWIYSLGQNKIKITPSGGTEYFCLNLKKLIQYLRKEIYYVQNAITRIIIISQFYLMSTQIFKQIKTIIEYKN